MRITPATDAEQGPFRKVVGTEPRPVRFNPEQIVEVLECGHFGRFLRKISYLAPEAQVKKRRRCHSCREVNP